MVYLGSVLVIAIILFFLWYVFSPAFSNFGGFLNRRAENFNKKWEGEEDNENDERNE